MNLNDIKREWKKDSVANVDDLGGESLRITELHSKYYNILAEQRRKFKLVEIEYNRLRKIKRDYYSGRLRRVAVEKLGWEQIEHELKEADIKDCLRGDEDLRPLEKEMALCEIKVDFLKDIIDAIHKRGYNIRNAIDWQKFKNGES